MVPQPLPEKDDEVNPLLFPAKLLDIRRVWRGPAQLDEVLVQWEGLEQEEATWEDRSALIRAFPNLEDNVPIWEGGNVTDTGVGGVETRVRPIRVKKKPSHLQDYIAHESPSELKGVSVEMECV